MEIRPEGFTEAGISTARPEEWIELLSAVGGYEIRWEGKASSALNALWGVPEDTSVTECLLAPPVADTGFIRLFRFEQVRQEVIRRGAHAWDSGGIFDLDIRVPAVRPCVDRLEKRDWTGVSQPVDWPFGEVRVREWLATGPEAVVLALIERLAPPLEGFEKPDGFSHVFNSSQVVSDMEAALAFYEKLGFVELLHHTGPLKGRGGEVLGLPPERAPETPVELVILQPRGEMSGSVELVRVEGLDSRDVSRRGLPFNLGLNLLRFPVADAAGYAAQLQARGLEPRSPVVRTRIEPWGETEIFAIQTPDGAWLEFYSPPG